MGADWQGRVASQSSPSQHDLARNILYGDKTMKLEAGKDYVRRGGFVMRLALILMRAHVE